jgi:predicted N-acetyltransferase YhbS
MAEVCVHESQRGRGLVKRLLVEAHAALVERGVPFAFLFGEPHIYGSSGYRHLSADVRRLDPVKNAFETGPSRVALFKPLSDVPWPEGVVDLRGPMF